MIEVGADRRHGALDRIVGHAALPCPGSPTSRARSCLRARPSLPLSAPLAGGAGRGRCRSVLVDAAGAADAARAARAGLGQSGRARPQDGRADGARYRDLLPHDVSRSLHDGAGVRRLLAPRWPAWIKARRREMSGFVSRTDSVTGCNPAARSRSASSADPASIRCSTTRARSTSTRPTATPSAPISVGTLAGVEVAFVPRHGVDHRFAPHRVPYRANLWALRAVGVRQVDRAVGGRVAAGRARGRRLVLPDQLVDRTWGRPHTFYNAGDGVHHAAVRRPVLPDRAPGRARGRGGRAGWSCIPRPPWS